MTNPTDITPETLATIQGDDTAASVVAIADLADRMAGRALGPLPIHHPGMLTEGAAAIRTLLVDREAQAAEIARLTAENERLTSEHDADKATFDLRWAADQRAIKRWQESAGRTKVWPDRADMVVLLLEIADRAEASHVAMTAERDAALSQVAALRVGLKAIIDRADDLKIARRAISRPTAAIKARADEAHECAIIASSALSTEGAPLTAEKTGGNQLADLTKAAVALLIGAGGGDRGEFTVSSDLYSALMTALPEKAQAELEASWLDGEIDGVGKIGAGDGPSIIQCNPLAAHGGEGGDHAE